MRIRTCILALCLLATQAEEAKPDEALARAVPDAKTSLTEAVGKAILKRHGTYVAAEYVLEDGKLAIRLTPKDGKPFTVPDGAPDAKEPSPPVSLPADPFLERVRKAELESPKRVLKVTPEETQTLPAPPDAAMERKKCVGNLQRIKTGLFNYEDAHGGQPPTSLAELQTWAFPNDPQVFLCSEMTGKEFKTQYAYIPRPVPEPPNANLSTWIVAFDDEPRHNGQRCVLFYDYHVGMMDEEEFRKAMAAQGHPFPEAPKKP